MVTLSFVSINNTPYTAVILTYILRVYEKVPSKCTGDDFWFWGQDLLKTLRLSSGYNATEKLTI